MTHICTRCQSSQTQVKQAVGAFIYKGAELPCEEIFTACDNCGHEFVTAEQSKEWNKFADIARRKHDNLLTPQKIKQIRTGLGLSQKNAAILFGGGVNAFSKYERGEVLQSIALDNVLRLAAKDPSIVTKLQKYRVTDNLNCSAPRFIQNNSTPTKPHITTPKQRTEIPILKQISVSYGGISYV